MKNQDILKELESISELMTENTVEAWNSEEEIQKTVVVMEDFETGDRSNVEYNGWSDRLEALIKALGDSAKESTAIESLVDRASPFLSYEDYDEMSESVVALTKLEDKNQSLDHSLGENVYPTEQYEHSFTVSSFLNAIGYESN